MSAVFGVNLKGNDMNRIFSTLLLVFLISLVTPCYSDGVSQAAIRVVSIDIARDLLSKGESVVVLDVRTPAEFSSGHIEGALNIDITDEEFSSKVSKLDKDRTYIVHCAANVENGRTDKSLKIMQSLGFSSLLDLSGGINKWKENGNPIIK